MLETDVELNMTINNRIEINPLIMLGKPVIRGTRVTVELILRRIGEGASVEEIIEMYPRLTAEDVHAAATFAADAVAHEATDLRDSQSYRRHFQ